MAENEKRFLNYENSMSIYRSKTAMIIGTLYFSQGYQSQPVLGMQFAECNDPNADQKTFNWDAEEKSWYFPTYDKCYELFSKLSKWKRILMSLKEQRNTNNDEIQSKYKDFAEKNKISNPIKKKSIYLSVRFYNGYFLTLTLFSTANGKMSVSVSLTEDEFDMLLQFVGDFVRGFHTLSLQHRLTVILRGNAKDGGGNGGGGNGGGSKGNYSGGGSKGGYSGKKQSSGPPDDDFGGEPASKPSSGGSSTGGGKKAGGDSVDDLLNGSSLDDLMGGVSPDDIPF